MWDMDTGKVVSHKVAHGAGPNPGPNDGWAPRFSNADGTHLTCLGFAKTAETYNGSNGFSLRMDGLSSTNSNVRRRMIVFHGSDYAHDNDHSYCGRSWGCPAMDYAVVKEFINAIKGGALVYSHYQGDSRNEVSDYVPGWLCHDPRYRAS